MFITRCRYILVSCPNAFGSHVLRLHEKNPLSPPGYVHLLPRHRILFLDGARGALEISAAWGYLESSQIRLM